MREHFFQLLYNLMEQDKRVYFITADLGYGLVNKIKVDFPDRYINCGAAEVAGMGLSVGLALSGKIPVFYSITPFALFRPAEVIRNYVNHEKIPVKIVTSGRGKDYEHDGFSHHGEDDKDFIKLFDNVIPYWPTSNDLLTAQFNIMMTTDQPFYLNLKR